MRAGLFVCSNGSRLVGAALCGAILTLGAAAQALAAPVCKPQFVLTDVHFSETHPETMQRRWTAHRSVDASRCASASGRFEILFTRQKENALETDFAEQFTWQAEQFTWKAGTVAVSVEFWADEAVESYRLGNVAACPCRE